MKIHKGFFLAGMLLLAGFVHGQSNYRGGALGFSARSTLNIFPHNNVVGIGAGGGWRLGFSKRVNTEWFFDPMISTTSDKSVFRKDLHIGWSVQFAFPKEGFGTGKVTPYILGGQCFDLTKVGIARSAYETPWKFSSAAQIGLGASKFMPGNFEVNAQVQYMVHMSKDIHVDEDPLSGAIVIEEENGFNPEGHILMNLGVSWYFAHAWRAKQ